MKKLGLLSVLLLWFLPARAGSRTLDSLNGAYREADVYKRIGLLNALQRQGESRKKTDLLFAELKKQVNASGIDSLKYIFMVVEGDRLAYSGNEGEGLKKFLSALSYFERNGLRKRASEVAYRIGRYYFYTDDLPKALKYVRLSDNLAPDGNPERVATNKMVMGVIYQNMHRPDSALYYQEQGLALKEKYGMIKSIPVSLNNIAELYSELNNDEKAISLLDRSINISDSLQVNDALAYAQHVKGCIYLRQKNYREALVWLLPASRFWENRQSYDDLKASYKKITEAYEAAGNYKNAFEYQKRYKAVSDSVMNEAKLKNAADLEARYQNEKNKLIIARQQAEKEVAETRSRNQLTIFVLVAVFLVINALVIYGRYKKQKKDKELIALQKIQLEVRNKDIEDSISYSSKVQQSIFPSHKDFTASFRDSFILFRPKEKVSGDFYWHERKGGLVLFAAADCTGHGVPGAMVSVVCSGALNRAVKEFGITDPGAILDKARELVVETFEKSETEVKDGMDISFCVLDRPHHRLYWAGANNPLWIIRKGQSAIEQVDPNKQPIGRHSQATPFTTHEVALQPGDTFYVFTDGYADQFGGEKGKKFKASKMKELLLQVQELDMPAQRDVLDRAFENWRGELEQIDDVCVIGVRV